MPEQILMEIVDIKDETYDVKTFRLKPLNNKEIDFIPGQYMLLGIEKQNASKDAKPFTFASSPTEKEFIKITVKKMHEFTTALHNLKIGNRLKITFPYGKSLNFYDSIKEDIVFIAGGSGITPFMGIIEYIIAKKLPNKIILLFSNRTEKDIIYKEEFKEIEKNNNIKIIHTLSNKWPENWNGETGRINKDMILKYVKYPKEKLWYLCGPPPMIDSVKKILEEIEIPKEKIKVEDWQIAGKYDEEK